MRGIEKKQKNLPIRDLAFDEMILQKNMKRCPIRQEYDGIFQRHRAMDQYLQNTKDHGLEDQRSLKMFDHWVMTIESIIWKIRDHLELISKRIIQLKEEFYQFQEI